MDHAAAQLTMFENPYNVSASHDPNASMAVLIEVAIAEAMFFGKFLGPLIGETIKVRVVMRAESEIATGGARAPVSPPACDSRRRQLPLTCS